MTKDGEWFLTQLCPQLNQVFSRHIQLSCYIQLEGEGNPRANGKRLYAVLERVTARKRLILGEEREVICDFLRLVRSIRAAK